jgi:uncharacterized repeat protein (TIGR03806 family)
MEPGLHWRLQVWKIRPRSLIDSGQATRASTASWPHGLRHLPFPPAHPTPMSTITPLHPLLLVLVLLASNVLAGVNESGLDTRPVDPACSLPERPIMGPGVGFRLQEVFEELSIPTKSHTLYQAPGDNSKWYLLERRGRIHAFANDPDVEDLDVILDIRDRVDEIPSEVGLKGLAFHPDWQNNGYVYISYSTTTGDPIDWFVSRFKMQADGVIDKGSEEVLIALTSTKDLHLSGQPAFGPDGYLYIGVGDFGSRSHGQNTETLQGSMLRLDVDASESGYGIPPSNPFTEGGGAPEIYAWGLRQPWAWSFDSLTGDLWLGDVGKEEREEVDIIKSGRNYGWGLLEGSVCGGECNIENYEPPVVEFERSESTCVIGGYVYRGTAVPDLYGAYLYGDWGSDQVYALRLDADGHPETPELVGSTGEGLYFFAEDQEKELYVVANRKIFKVVTNDPEAPATPFPQRLSDLACFDGADPSQPDDALIPYDVNVPFWSDGITKERFLSLPADTVIEFAEDGDWVFPIGTILVKHFRLEDQLVETRLFVRHDDSTWAGYSYEWNDAQSDAELLEGTKTKVIGNQTWTFPSRTACLACHTAAAGHALGLETAQLNREFTYPQTGRTANQLSTFQHIGLFESELGAPPEALPQLPSLLDESYSVEERARAFLHVNCSNCHQPDHTLNVRLDFRVSVPLEDMGICNVKPNADTFGLADARILAPGAPESSTLLHRIGLVGSGSMPPIAKSKVDRHGAALITEWINTQSSCGESIHRPRFIRGDSNSDRIIDIADGVFTLKWLFVSAEEPLCLEALDVDADRVTNITDALAILGYLFLGGPSPQAPFPSCAPAEAPAGCAFTICPDF